MRVFLMMILSCGLLLGGCEQETVVPVETQAEPPEKIVAAEPAQQQISAVVDHVTEVVEAGAQQLKETGAAAKLVAQEVVVAVVQDVTIAADIAEQKATDFVETLQQQAVEIQVDLKQEGTQLLSDLVDNSGETQTPNTDLLASVVAVAVAVPDVTETHVSEFVVFEGKKGVVTLTHAKHGEQYGCVVCHGDVAPGAYELGKSAAHTMCKRCHKADGGPVKCGGCHIK